MNRICQRRGLPLFRDVLRNEGNVSETESGVRGQCAANNAMQVSDVLQHDVSRLANTHWAPGSKSKFDGKVVRKLYDEYLSDPRDDDYEGVAVLEMSSYLEKSDR